MADIRQIIKQGDPVLRAKSVEVRRFNETLHNLLDDMAVTMMDADGVGLAAPQVGINKRIIVVRSETDQVLEFVNPVIKDAKGNHEDLEGCLSVPGIQGKVPRATKLTVEAQDRNGVPFTFKAEDFTARILQHEIDHLEGRLFIDIMTEEV